MAKTPANHLAETAFKAYGKTLHRYLMRRLMNAQGAQDLAQEAYLRLLRVDDAEFVKAPQAYLFRIASNLVYDLKMRERRDPVTFNSALVAHAAERVSDPNAREPGETIDTAQQLEAMLAQLPPLQAAILLMKKRDGLSLEEIAAALEISVHTVKKYLCRAVAECRMQTKATHVHETTAQHRQAEDRNSDRRRSIPHSGPSSGDRPATG